MNVSLLSHEWLVIGLGLVILLIDLWVPARFTERYERTEWPKEIVRCEATYENYRRFEVTVRIR